MMSGGYGVPTNKGYADLFDDRVILGRKGTDKIQIIIKIQAMFRGALARKSVKQRHGFVARTFAMLDRNQYQGDPNYNNLRVQEIKAMLGPFEYPSETTTQDQEQGAQRYSRPLQVLENGA